MRQRVLVLAAIAALIIGAIPLYAYGVNRTDSEQDAAIDRLNCTTYGEDCATPIPHTATPQPTATNTAAPTATNTPTNTPTATATPDVTLTGWHAPSDHEHGDAPPQWATDWSMATFGHGIVFGGDETTGMMEHTEKHAAYKGYFIYRPGIIELYVRTHEAANPMDRQARWHSYEVYAKDPTGAISFWQGWLDRGDPATQRLMICDGSFAGVDPLRGTPHGWVMLGCPGPLEQWYTRGPDWSWDIVNTIEDGTTVYSPDETMHDPVSLWTLTGNKGVHRNLVAQYYEDDATRYPSRNDPALRGWFCATPMGQITGSVGGPNDCAAGTLAQYVAPTMPTVETNGVRHFDYPSTGITNPAN